MQKNIYEYLRRYKTNLFLNYASTVLFIPSKKNTNVYHYLSRFVEFYWSSEI
jgi:hypothetical protein